jgi:hypothetical protein
MCSNQEPFNQAASAEALVLRQALNLRGGIGFLPNNRGMFSMAGRMPIPLFNVGKAREPNKKNTPSIA